MKKLYEIAEEFFKAFEGRHLYPKLFSWEWLLWCASVAVFFHTFFFTINGHTEPSVLRFALTYSALYISSELMRRHKKKTLLAFGATSQTLHIQQTALLEKLTRRPATEFLSLANDIRQLLDLRQQGMLQEVKTRELMPIPWTKGQFVMYALTLAGLSLAAIGAFILEKEKVPFRDELIRIVLIYGSMGLVASLTIVPLGKYAWHTFLLELRMWQARLQKGEFSKQVHLEYMLQSLVELHDPSGSAQKARPKIRAGHYPASSIGKVHK